MRDAFGYVLFGVVVVGGLGAIVSLALRRSTYKEIGKGGFFKDDDAPRRPAPGGPIDIAERDEEIRQLLRARNARHSEHGGEIVDVETELARLTAPAVDPALVEEIREFVIKRNERLIERGKQPLDVDAEVERRLREL